MLFALPLLLSTFHIDYASYVGGSQDETAVAIAADADGNAYVTGTTDSPDFPLTSTAFGAPSTQHPCAFVSKVNPAGTGLVWSVCLAGMTPLGIALDSADNVYVLSFQRIVKLSSEGNLIVYSRSFNRESVATAFAVDAVGNAYVVGSTTQLTTTPGALQPNLAPGACDYPGNACPDGFVIKLAPDGSTVYATYLGGSGQDRARAVAADWQGNAWISGDTESPDFPLTRNALQSTFHGVVDLGAQFGDAFVSELDPTGSKLLYSTYLGGSGADGGFAVAVDSTGAAYVAGYTQSPDFPITPGALQTTYTGPTNTPPAYSGSAFVTKFTASGALAYSTFAPGAVASEILVDSQADVYLPDSAGLNVLSPDGSAIVRSIPVNGSMALDGQGSAYVTGTTQGYRFFSTQGAVQTKFGGGYDATVIKLDFTGPQSALITSIVNAASQRTGLAEKNAMFDVAPGEIITVYGEGLDNTTRLLFDGIAAPILYVSSGQINAVVPFEVGPPVTTLTLITATQTFGQGRMNVYPVVPALFTADGSGKGQAAVLNQDGSINSPSNPAPRGSTISVFMTGAGAMTPRQPDGSVTPTMPPFPNVQLSVVSRIGQVTYAGAAPGLVAGAVQVNVQILPNLGMTGSVPLVLYVGGYASGFIGDTIVSLR